MMCMIPREIPWYRE